MAWAILLVLALGLVFLRAQSFSEPLEQDLTVYTLIGQGLLEGRPFYADLWDHKPPGVHLAYALALALALALEVAPSPQAAVNLLNVAVNLACMLGLYLLLTRQTRSRLAGLLAAGGWLLYSGDPRLQGNQPNVELFVNAALIWAWAAWLAVRGDRLDVRRCLGTGALLFLATFFKPVALAPAAFLALAHLWTARKRLLALGQVLGIAATGALLWALFCAVMAGLGLLGPCYEAVILYNRGYGGDLLANLLAAFSWEYLAPGSVMAGIALPLAAAFAAALCLLPSKPGVEEYPRTLAATLLALTPAAVLAIGLPGRFYPHYYQLWLPLACAGVGLIPAAAQRLPMQANTVGTALLALLLGVGLVYQAPFWFKDVTVLARYKYGSVPEENLALARWTAEILEPGETLYVWDNRPAVAFYSGRAMASGLFFITPLTEGPLAPQLAARAARQLRETPPDLFLLNESLIPGRETPAFAILVWMDAHYVPVTRVGPFSFRLRKDSAALARFTSSADLYTD